MMPDEPNGPDPKRPEKPDDSPFRKGDPKPTENPQVPFEEVPSPDPIVDPVQEPPQAPTEPGKYVA